MKLNEIKRKKITNVGEANKAMKTSLGQFLISCLSFFQGLAGLACFTSRQNYKCPPPAEPSSTPPVGVASKDGGWRISLD